MTNIIDVDFEKDMCMQCHIREATKLCDFVIGRQLTFWNSYVDFKNQTEVITCDCGLCDECAEQVAGWDYCKRHAPLMRKGIE